jgi:glycine cleavage system aminomethyltransferase T
LKRLVALATVAAPDARPGTRLEIEVTVEAARKRVTAVVTPTPFFAPARKAATPPA